jgi:hypothetical protein
MVWSSGGNGGFLFDVMVSAVREREGGGDAGRRC